ncbi:MAG: SDR family NAD(P)-dependent oxidoreductase [Actinomycetota bacterium]
MNNSRTIAGRTVCVTGASSGMGRAIAEHLGALGAHVFLTGRTLDEMSASARRIRAAGGRADVDDFDLTDTDRLVQWIDHAATLTGRLDVLVNSAGFGDIGSSIIDGDPEMWRGMLNVNVLALAVGCQAAVRAMRRTGSDGNIINVSSTATLRRDSGVYGATKYAVNCINSTLRSELENDSIRVTALIPGVFASNFSRHGDPSRITARADAAGITDLDLSDSRRLTPDQIETIQSALPTTMGNTTHIARAVEYIAAQPIELNIEELVIRPQKSLF